MTALLKSKITLRSTLAAVALALVVSIVMGRETPPPTAAGAHSAPAARQPTASEPPPDLDLHQLSRTRGAEHIPDLFAPRKPPAPAMPQPAGTEPPPPVPSAPALPFTYLGKLIDGEKVEIFIAHGAEHYSAEKGKTIADEYRVEKITAQAVTFIYLPLGTRQSLSIPVTE